MKTKRFLAGITGLCLAAASLLPLGASAGDGYDCNADGTFDILDIISLTKYLHLRGSVASPEDADVNGDGAVDIFDLSLMLRALVEMEPEMTITSKNLADKVEPQAVTSVVLDQDFSVGQTRFALNLLRENLKAGENSLVSPYSVSQALGMAANGAMGQTREEMETVLGGSTEDLNHAFYTFRRAALKDQDVRLNTANSIWVREQYPVSDAFLQTNANFYGADAYATPMDDSTIRDVNNWVDLNTDHMIPSILPKTMNLSATELILVNAVAFDAEWAVPYDEYSVSEGTFTKADGTEETADYLIGDTYIYLEDDHATGFMQYYKGNKYAFAALLPEEGMTPEDYLATLTADGLYNTLSNPQNIHTYTSLPEFKYDYSVTLNDGLKRMGMPTAFDPGTADFTGMADIDTGLYLQTVLHKTFIEVTPLGTRAGAATAALVADGCAMEDYKEVHLDRPFVYAIVDTQTSVPIFIGTVHSTASTN